MLKCHENYQNCWYDTKKFDSGFFARIEIFEFEDSWYTVTLSIGKKKKKVNGYFEANSDSNTLTTNKSGIEPLVWAKNTLADFILHIKDYIWNPKNYPIHFFIVGDDNRRNKVYKWGLGKIGFTEGIFRGRKALHYKVERK